MMTKSCYHEYHRETDNKKCKSVPKNIAIVPNLNMKNGIKKS